MTCQQAILANKQALLRLSRQRSDLVVAQPALLVDGPLVRRCKRLRGVLARPWEQYFLASRMIPQERRDVVYLRAASHFIIELHVYDAWWSYGGLAVNSAEGG